MLLQSEQEKEALKADAAQAKQQLCRYSFVVLLLCAFCLFPNASTCTCCLGNVIPKAVKQTKYQSWFTVLNFYPWAVKGWWGISLSTSDLCEWKCTGVQQSANHWLYSRTKSVWRWCRSHHLSGKRWRGCHVGDAWLPLEHLCCWWILKNIKLHSLQIQAKLIGQCFIVQIDIDPSCKEAGCSSITQPITCCPWIKDMI